MPRTRTTDDAPTFAEHVCLALVVEAPRHGWSLVKELAPDGAIGSIWSLSRSLTYRAVEQLEARALVERGASEPGRGPTRVTLHATADGVAATEAWLARPARHVRDLRTEFLVKATLLQRAGADVRPLLDAQRRHLAPVLASLAAAVDDEGATPVELWRRESALAASRFFERLGTQLGGAHPPST